MSLQSSPAVADRAEAPANFIEQIVQDDLNAGHVGQVVTRFPPEPNGYLHIGHAKAICIDFGVAEKFGGRCHLRFDDTNPTREEEKFAEAIREDVRWLGFDWGQYEYHASDHYPRLYEWACHLIREGLAYVDDQSGEQVSKTRGTLTSAGVESPCRNRPAEESLDLFARMKAGEFGDGEKVLRARIDMAAANLNLRDPVLYRIVHATHPRTGDDWCIYPTYDFAHGQSDAIEGVTHSLCSLEFEDHRPLYDWLIERLSPTSNVRSPKSKSQGSGLKSQDSDQATPASRPKQIEFARLNLTHTLTTKRKLRTLVDQGHVDGWDDPRMPTLRGMRRRGMTAEAIRNFCHTIGVTKFNARTEMQLLEHHLREDLNQRAQRRTAVLNPLKVIITNYPEGQVEMRHLPNNPEDEAAGTREVPFSRELFIDRNDFLEDPPKKFFRLAPGKEVRLRFGYFITCQEVIKDDTGAVIELHCTYDPQTGSGKAPDGRKVKGTLHWVSAAHAIDAEVRLYDHLFTGEDPEAGGENAAAGDEPWKANLNAESLEILEGCKLEPTLADSVAGEFAYQFERTGYFIADLKDHRPEQPVFNRTIPLKDTWAKMQQNS